MKPAILIVDDESTILFVFSNFFKKTGYEVLTAENIAQAVEAVQKRRFDAILLDLNLPDGSSMSWIKELREDCPELAIVVITGQGDVPTAVEAMRLGADNFLTKPVNMNELDVFLKKSLELSGLRRSEKVWRRSQKTEEPFFGQNAAMGKARELMLLMSENDVPVLLQGETGTGKGVFARWTHDHSLRNRDPYIEVNCSTFSRELLVSELFGHVRGAFTSAHQNKQGLIEIADGGTLFLDEIGDMDIQVQSQLLKVLEDKMYRKMGETTLRKSDFRLISASNKDLQNEVKKGSFRHDLFFRINQVPISIPPLRERTEDIPAFTEYLLGRIGSAIHEVPPEVTELLKSYDWPGNVRELKNIIERAYILSRGQQFRKEHFPGLAVEIETNRTGIPKISVLKEREYEQIQSLISETGGDMEKVAEELGISRATLYRRLKELRSSNK